MSEAKNNPSTQGQKQEKTGVLKRLVEKLDSKMKAKADAKSQQSSCCSGSNNGGKCC